MMRTVYKVFYIESERGWGSKTFDIKYFSTESAAKKAIAEYNAYNTETVTPSWYCYAQGPYRVEYPSENEIIHDE
jgi:transcription initiation factor IIF auxiliary subunit